MPISREIGQGVAKELRETSLSPNDSRSFRALRSDQKEVFSRRSHK